MPIPLERLLCGVNLNPNSSPGKLFMGIAIGFVAGAIVAGAAAYYVVGNNSGQENNAPYSFKPSEPVLIAPVQSCDKTAPLGEERNVLISYRWHAATNADHYRVELRKITGDYYWGHLWPVSHSTTCRDDLCIASLTNVNKETDYEMRVVAYGDMNETPELTSQSPILEFRTLSCP